MHPHPLPFILFTAFNAVATAMGMWARRRRWLNESTSRRIHFHTVVWLWSTAGGLSIWAMPLKPTDAWLVIFAIAQVAVGAYLMIPLARRLGLSRSHIGCVSVASALNNSGFSMGAYLVYCILAPGEVALAYGIAIVTVMQAVMVPLVYPIALYFGGQGPRPRIAPLLIQSFFDLRAMPLYAAIVGLTLSGTGVPRPAWISAWHVLDVLIFAGAGGAMFGIGMRLRLMPPWHFPREMALLAGAKFLLLPGLTLGGLWLAARSPWGIDPLLRDVLTIEAFVPTALLSVMLANLFHLDTRLAAHLWLWNTILFLAGPAVVLILWYT